MSNSFRSCRAACVLAVAAFAHGPPLAAADASDFPDDTESVVVVNLKQLLGCEAVAGQPDALGELKGLLGQFAGLDLVQAYLKPAGLDAYRDVRRLTYAYAGGTDPQVNFVVLEGAFDADKLNAAALVGGEAFRATQSGGRTQYELCPRGQKRFYAALATPTTLITAATPKALADAQSRAAGGKPSGLNALVKATLEAAGDGQSLAFASTGAGLARRLAGVPLPDPETAAAFLRTLDAVAGGVTLAKGVRFQLAVNADSEDAAKRLADSAASGTRTLQTLTQQNAARDAKYLPVGEVVASLRFTSRGTAVRLAGGASLDTLEALLKNFPVAVPGAAAGKSP